MLPASEYELLDVGDGRKLERWAGIVLDRPCPAAEGIARTHSRLWTQADARFQRQQGLQGIWRWARPCPDPWDLAHPLGFRLQLIPTPAGQIGVFPEQAGNWEWIAQRLAGTTSDPWQRGVDGADQAAHKVLNLFAYTGGSTLAAASAGAAVAHVDGAKNIVQRARDNAASSGLGAAPIRWLCEDATKFVQRELKRGNRYRGVILDPPSYGHGPKGQSWSIDADLAALWSNCLELLEPQQAWLLLSCHSPGWDEPALRRLPLPPRETWPRQSVTIEPLFLETAAGRKLPSGVALRWEGDASAFASDKADDLREQKGLG